MACAVIFLLVVVKRKMKIFDGCTEFGSESAAFKNRGHDVTTLGLEGDVNIKMDIRDFHTKDHYDFMWFSPPCTEFSIAIGKRCKDREVDLSIVKACFNIVEDAKPTYWIIENPRGCLRHFIGKPTVTVNYSDYGFITIKPTDLWGIFPWFWSNTKTVKNIVTFESISGFRSLVPYGLSLALCAAMERSLET